MDNKKKILVLVDWFAPGYRAGGPIQSCVNFAFALKEHFEILVLSTDTDHGESEPYPGIVANEWTRSLDPDIGVYYAAKKTLTLSQLRRVMLESKADYIYLNHLFSPRFVVYPLWLAFRGKLASRLVLCPRGALYESALAVKPYKKRPFIRLFNWMGIHRKITFHATNDRERAAILAYFPGSRVLVADNLPNAKQPPFKGIEKKAGSLSCIFIARIVPIKNLLYLLETLENQAATIQLTIVGPAEDEAYWSLCAQKIKALPSNITVNYLGAIDNKELIALLQLHHLFILPTEGENFGHSIFEALLAGRPVLISDQTPWQGLAAKKAGWDLPLGNPSSFGDVIAQTAGWDQQAFDQWARASWQYARDFIQNPELIKQYLDLFI